MLVCYRLDEASGVVIIAALPPQRGGPGPCGRFILGLEVLCSRG